MFIYQGQKSFYLWNKVNPEIDDELVELQIPTEMIKIGITGSLSSGKTTASKILSLRGGPLFSADKAVKKFIKTKNFRSLIVKNLKLKSRSNKEIFKKVNIEE